MLHHLQLIKCGHFAYLFNLLDHVLWLSALLNLSPPRVQVPGNENPSTLIAFATKTVNAGQIASKLHVIELGAQPGVVTLCHLILVSSFHLFTGLKCPSGSYLLLALSNNALILAGKPSFTKKQADLFFPPDFGDDFPVAMQVLGGNV